jgi:pimeloyl-ACP methyl ester carboxylesterase
MRALFFVSFILALSFVSAQIKWYDCPVYTNRYVEVNATSSIDEQVNQQVVDDINDLIRQIKSDGISQPFMPSIIFSKNTLQVLQMQNGIIPMAQCATVEEPLDYSNPNGTKISIFVKRLVSNVASPKPGLWILQGGPGASTDSLESLMEAFSKLVGNNYDIYLPEHRGVGRSTRLSCIAPQAETLGSDGGVLITPAEYIPCVSEFASVNYPGLTGEFSSENAARDVLDLITTIKAQAEQANQYLYGISYGTMWATRIMQLPNADAQVAGVILDSVVSTAGNVTAPNLRTTFDQWDKLMNDVGFEFLNKCGNDTFCQGKITKDPISFTVQVFEKLFSNGTCSILTSPYNITADYLRLVLGSMLMKRNLRELIPAVLYRLNRCDSDLDVPTLQFFFDNLNRMYSTTLKCVPLSSEMLQFNIGFSEMWSTSNPDYNTLYAIYNTTYLATGMYKIAAIKNNTQWPIYNAEFLNQGFTTQRPVLLLNGNLDPQTPLLYAEQQYNNINSMQKQLIVFPNAVHGVIANTPVNVTALDCGMQVILSYLANSGDLAKLDTSCLAMLIPISFQGNPNLNQQLMGVEDIFEDAYEPPEVVKTVNLYLFIGVEAGTAVLAIIIICTLIYYIVQLKDKESQYEDLDAERH